MVRLLWHAVCLICSRMRRRNLLACVMYGSWKHGEVIGWMGKRGTVDEMQFPRNKKNKKATKQGR